MQYAVIVWWTENKSHRGHIYGWYESLATATSKASNLVRWGAYKAIAVDAVTEWAIAWNSF